MFVRRRWRKNSWSCWISGVFFGLLVLLMLSLRTALRLHPREQGELQHDYSLAWIMAQISWQDYQKSLVLLPDWPANRSQRFPSIAQRIKFYLGPSWSHLLLEDEDGNDCNQTTSTNNPQFWSYNYQQNGSVVVLSPHQQIISNHNENAHSNDTTASAGSKPSHAISFTISNEATLGNRQAIFVHVQKVQACADSPDKPTRYCQDILKTVIPAADMSINHTLNDNDAPPILVRFGDSLQPDTPYPLFQKFRPALPNKHKTRRCGNTNDTASSLQWPIIWKLNTERHYAVLDQVASHDIYWQYKKNQAMFRGALSGWRVPAHVVAREGNDDHEFMTKRCQQSTRYDHFEDPLIDAKLIALRPGLNATVNGRIIKGHRKSLVEMLRYKGLIVLEGNDVASGLKWSLISRSVVIMPVPTKSSWAMEEALEPWVHYVPLAADGHDAQTQMQWVLDHDVEAQRIAHRGSLWMQDLMAGDADGTIFQKLLQAYRRAFVLSSPSSQPKR